MNIPDQHIDVALVSLTILSYALPKKEVIADFFVETIDKITPKLLDKNSHLLECRLSLFLGYYIDILYREDNETFLKVLQMLVSSMDSEKLSLAHQSLDTLNTIISDKDLIPRVTPLISELTKFVISCMKKVNIPLFFSFVSELLKWYTNGLSKEDHLSLLESVVDRLQLEVKDIRENNFKTNMAIQKIWHLIDDYTQLRIVKEDPEMI